MFVSSQEDQREDELGVLSAAKVLADAAKKNVNTYTGRRRAVSTGSEGVRTASRLFSTAEESVRTVGASMPVTTAAHIQVDEDLAQKMLEEERKSLSIAERARLLAELIDKRKKLQVTYRYEAIENKPQTMSQQRKTTCTYLKNMADTRWNALREKAFMKSRRCLMMFTNRLPHLYPWTQLWEKREQKEQE
uniref:Uncharacterized protein n=1 Tax=Tanacetum cinerariifolium TaxID=118510 RepID=A0A699I1H4_TANCI|nr:hypothetical protein [Tanacetum cinerariifolium]